MLIALNSLHSGSLGGLSGADKMCQDASRISSLTGTFKAFMSGIDRSLKSLISARYRRLPVVNVKVWLLFDWLICVVLQCALVDRKRLCSSLGKQCSLDNPQFHIQHFTSILEGNKFQF